MTPRTLLPLLAAVPLAFLTLASAACEDSTEAQDAPTATPTVNGIAVGEPTPPGRPSTTPTDTPKVSLGVEWLTLNHAGAGAVTLLFETTVPTTASAQGLALANPGNVKPLPPQVDDILATSHTITLGTATFDMMWEVTVTDASGNTARATIESGQIVQQQYWARTGEFAPRVTLGGNLSATATWANLYGQAKVIPGHVTLVARRAACTTAEACLGAPVATFDADQPTVTSDKLLEQHAIRLEFPDAAHDYQVLLVGEPGGPQDRAFYQVDVLAGDLK